MMTPKPRNVFDIAGVELRDYKLSLAFKLAVQGAKRYKLHNDYLRDFRNVRLLAFEAHDWALAAEKLAILLRKLSDEISVGGNEPC